MEPARLHLEITESVMFDDQRADPIKILEAISALGVKISLDDFGTGYSSLSYLKRLPIDTLKIDRSFIMELERDADGQALVEAIVSMARSLEISVICEGAETAEQCDLISSFGCALIQGLQHRPADGRRRFPPVPGAHERPETRHGAGRLGYGPIRPQSTHSLVTQTTSS
ncbi:EAL domain-containing protein [Roseibium salinum]|nr:EAL domain-containing protein [Roseibium salinum]